MYKNPHKDGIKSIDVPTTTYSKDDHWVKRSVLVSGLDLSTDSIDLSQAVNIVRQVVPFPVSTSIIQTDLLLLLVPFAQQYD